MKEWCKVKPQKAQCLVCLLPFVLLGCDIASSQRDATLLSMPEMAAPLSEIISSGMLESSSDQSPDLCDSDGCATAAAALRPLFGSATSSFTSLLESADGRISDFESRIVDHYVPCLEADESTVDLELSGNFGIKSVINCYAHFASPDDPSAERYEQFVFGASQSDESYSIINRIGLIEGYVQTIWMNQDSSENVEVWYGQNFSTTNAGAAFSHLKLFAADGIVELSTAGLYQIIVENSFTCGAQVRFNSSYIYLTGKFVEVSEDSAVSCDGVDETNFCLDTSDLSSVASSNCEDDDLDSFSLDAVDPDDLVSDSWGAELNLDYSETVDRFALEGLEKQDVSSSIDFKKGGGKGKGKK